MDIVRALHGTHGELRSDERPPGIAEDGLNAVAALQRNAERRPVTRVDADARRIDRGTRIALRRDEDRLVAPAGVVVAMATRAGDEASEENHRSEAEGQISNAAHERLL